METGKNSVSSKTLDQVRTVAPMIVQEIRGGWHMRQRLNQLGIHEGDVLIVQRCCAMRGPILVRIHGVGVALGRGVARHIRVRPQDEKSG
ncbi:ferrous iron transport protein A [bacterium]|nr:ferrous iron transport protein A [bacterium]